VVQVESACTDVSCRTSIDLNGKGNEDFSKCHKKNKLCIPKTVGGWRRGEMKIWSILGNKTEILYVCRVYSHFLISAQNITHEIKLTKKKIYPYDCYRQWNIENLRNKRRFCRIMRPKGWGKPTKFGVFVQEQNFKRALSVCFKTKIKICPIPKKSSEMYSVSLLNNLLHTITSAHTLHLK